MIAATAMTLERAWARLSRGDHKGARQLLTGGMPLTYAPGTDSYLSWCRALAHCALGTGDLALAHHHLWSALDSLAQPAVEPVERLTCALDDLSGPENPLELIRLAYSVALVSLHGEAWGVLDEVLDHALRMPALTRHPALRATLQSLLVLSSSLSPGKPVRGVAALRTALVQSSQRLAPGSARLPRVALAISGALLGERGALFQLEHLHEVLSGPWIACQGAVDSFAPLVEEVGLLLGAQLAPSSQYGQDLQTFLTGRSVPAPVVPQERSASHLPLLETFGPGVKRRAWFLRQWTRADPDGVQINRTMELLEQQVLAGPRPTLDRVSVTRYSTRPGLPLWAYSRLGFVADPYPLRIPVTLRLLGPPSVIADGERILPGLSIDALTLLALVGEEFPPEHLPALMAGRENPAPRARRQRYTRVRSELTAAGIPAGLLNENEDELRVDRAAQMDCDVSVLREWLRQGEYWGSLALLSRGAWPAASIRWLSEGREDVLQALAQGLWRLRATEVSGPERRWVIQGARWIIREWETKPALDEASRPAGSDSVLPSSRQITTLIRRLAALPI